MQAAARRVHVQPGGESMSTTHTKRPRVYILERSGRRGHCALILEPCHLEPGQTYTEAEFKQQARVLFDFLWSEFPAGTVDECLKIIERKTRGRFKT